MLAGLHGEERGGQNHKGSVSEGGRTLIASKTGGTSAHAR